MDRARPLFEPYPDVPVYVAKHDLITTITGYNLTGGILVAMYRTKMPSAGELIRSLECGDSVESAGSLQNGNSVECGKQAKTDPSGKRIRLAVMEGIVNPANVGAIIRSAAALNMDAVLVTKDCADPLYRRAIRVGMGCVFQVPWTYIPPLSSGGIDLLHELGFTVAAMALTDHTLSVKDAGLQSCKKLALVLGAEGEGLSPETIEACDHAVKIPMSHGVDSLNVAAASAVAFYALAVSD